MTQEEVIRKIEKLLRLSSSPVEAEASAALAKAQALMMEYNLSQVDIPVEGKSKVEFIRNQKIAELPIGWQSAFMKGLANIFDCTIFASKSPNHGLHFVKAYGAPADVEVLRTIFTSMKASIAALWASESIKAKAMGLIGRSRGETMRYKEGWHCGCTYRLIERLKEQKAHQMQQDVRCRALVVKKMEVTGTMLKEDNIKLKGTTKTKKAASTLGWFDGAVAGNKIEMNKKVGA
jgi:hypothetical protein